MQISNIFIDEMMNYCGITHIYWDNMQDTYGAIPKLLQLPTLQGISISNTPLYRCRLKFTSSLSQLQLINTSYQRCFPKNLKYLHMFDYSPMTILGPFPFTLKYLKTNYRIRTKHNIHYVDCPFHPKGVKPAFQVETKYEENVVYFENEIKHIYNLYHQQINNLLDFPKVLVNIIMEYVSKIFKNAQGE
jgi:hypothetical protein